MADYAISRSPVKMSLFSKSKSSNDAIVQRNTKINVLEAVTFDYNKNIASSSFISIIEIKRLASGQLVSTKVQAYQVSEVVQITTAGVKLDKQDVVFRDNTDFINLTLFGDDVNTLQECKFYSLQNVRVKIFKDFYSLNTSRMEPFEHEEIKSMDGMVDVPNISSLSEATAVVRIIGIQKLEQSVVCISCQRKTANVDEQCSILECEHCKLSVRRDSCGIVWWANLMLADSSNCEKFKISFRNDQVIQLGEIFGFTLASKTKKDLEKTLLEITDVFKVIFDTNGRVALAVSRV